MTDRTELRAGDAAPIVGEREAFEAWASDNIDRLIAAHLGVDETTQFGKRIAASFLCAAAWNARAALPSGGGAREAAKAGARHLIDTYVDASHEDKVRWIEAATDRLETIITKHIPSAPAGLTEEPCAWYRLGNGAYSTGLPTPAKEFLWGETEPDWTHGEGWVPLYRLTTGGQKP